MKDWFTCLHKCVVTLNMNTSKAKGIFPFGRFLCFTGRSGEVGMGKAWVFFFSISPQIVLSLPDAFGIGSGLQLQGL